MCTLFNKSLNLLKFSSKIWTNEGWSNFTMLYFHVQHCSFTEMTWMSTGCTCMHFPYFPCSYHLILPYQEDIQICQQHVAPFIITNHCETGNRHTVKNICFKHFCGSNVENVEREVTLFLHPGGASLICSLKIYCCFILLLAMILNCLINAFMTHFMISCTDEIGNCINSFGWLRSCITWHIVLYQQCSLLVFYCWYQLARTKWKSRQI